MALVLSRVARQIGEKSEKRIRLYIQIQILTDLVILQSPQDAENEAEDHK